MWQPRIRPPRRPEAEPLTPPSAPPAAAPLVQQRVHLNEQDAADRLTAAILKHLRGHAQKPTAVTVVCIGSDRSTGDALGPLVGSRLSERLGHPALEVRGTLETPVHAANLSQHLLEISGVRGDRVVLAVDACLGRAENVGTACVKPGPLKPGTGVNKNLPSIGSFHIVGVVNVGGFMEYFVLQNTRLNLVVRLADLIAESLADALQEYTKNVDIPQVAVTLDM